MRPLAITACLFASTIAYAQHDPLLDGMRDRARPVLLFAGAHDARLHTQYEELAQHRGELADRQMRLVLVTDAPEADHNPPVGTVVATAEEAATLRKRFHVGPGSFVVLLLGKDGGEKLRSTRPVSFDTLRSLVDAMPMRQQEMHSR